jgi:dTDP-4-dehydrorhamnose 3,5-epimerase
VRVDRGGLEGVLVFTPEMHGDARGRFRELWRELSYREAGISQPFVQDNASVSGRDVLRGLHFQHPGGQGKLVTVLTGEAQQVLVDVRRGSPTFGRHLSYRLAGEAPTQVYVPSGFAHGVLMLTDTVVLTYKCTAYFDASATQCVRWDDPDLGIAWGVRSPVVSAQDASAPRLVEIAAERLPTYEA